MAQQIMDLGLWLIPAVLVAVLGVGRMARLVTHDQFPPSAWLRAFWQDKVTAKRPAWSLLFICFWCLSPWIMLVAIVWFLFTLQYEWVAWAWWFFWGWMALSYVAAMITARDEPGE